MKRRDFLKSAFYSSLAYGVGTGVGSLFTFSDAFASNGSGTVSQRTLVNLMLIGGADQRFLFVPAPGSAYAAKFWEKRQNIYRYNADTQALYNSYEDVWNDLYYPTEYNGYTFGIHKNASWLYQEFLNGNVAIVANMVASENRRHDHSQLIMHTGDVTTGQYQVDRDGWGGRLVAAGNVGDNVVCMSNDVQPFCQGINPGNRLENVVHVRDSRNFALPGENNGNPASARNVMARALAAYYKERGIEIEQQIAQNRLKETWPFRRFFKHEQAIREFGDAFKQRLDAVQPTLPYQIANLSNKYSSSKLSSGYFARQIANLYDSMIGADILRLKSAYIEYTGWDTHKWEKRDFERNILDIFGGGKGLSALYSALSPIQGAAENLTFVITSDFGRQLAANGDHGTDHGRGTYGIVIGKNVNGGVYGEMFPQSEVTPNTENQTRFDMQGTDIEGRTSFEWILGAACDWATPNSSQVVFPNLGSAPPRLETGVDPTVLFKPGHAVYGSITLQNGVALHEYEDVTISASNGSATNDALMQSYGHYRIGSLVDGTYTIQPKHKYINFEPASISIPMNGADSYDVNFTAIPLLHFFYFYKINVTDPTTGAITYRVILIGQNFIPGATTLTVGQTPFNIVAIYSLSGLSYLIADVTGSSAPTGSIVITTSGTNPETYTHDVLYEDLPQYGKA